MSDRIETTGPGREPGGEEPTVPEIEVDETVAPRPEEEIADVARAEPDTEDHGRLAG